MKEILKKFSSRKFLVAIAGIAMGLVAFFGVDESAVAQVAGTTVSVVSIISYILGEAKIDAAAVSAEKDEKVGEDA